MHTPRRGEGHETRSCSSQSAGAGTVRLRDHRVGNVPGTHMTVSISRGTMRTWGRTAAMVTLVAALVTACSAEDAMIDGPQIVIGSFGFGESEILGEIYGQGLAAVGYDTVHRAQMGNRETVKPALEAGEIGFVPEYVGSAVEVGFGRPPSPDATEAHAELTELFAMSGVTVLDLAPAEDTNTFAVLRSLAETQGLATVSDLAELGTVRLGGPPECADRPRCKVGLETTYGLTVEFTPLDTGGPLTLAALRSGEIDVGLFLSTFIFDDDLVALEDDRGLQPAENIVPVVRTDLIDAYGSELADRVNLITSRLTTLGLVELNRQFLEEGRDAAEIAAAWLANRNLMPAGAG